MAGQSGIHSDQTIDVTRVMTEEQYHGGKNKNNRDKTAGFGKTALSTAIIVTTSKMRKKDDNPITMLLALEESKGE